MDLKWEFEAVLEKEDHVLMWEAKLMVPDRISNEIRAAQPDRRVVATFNEGISQQAALMPNGDGRYFIMLNKQMRKKLGIGDGSKIRVTVEPDKSPYGAPMSEEMEMVLAEDASASRHFHALSPGKQRALIFQITKIKNPDLRIRKSWIIAEHLNRNSGRLDFRELNEDYRNG